MQQNNKRRSALKTSTSKKRVSTSGPSSDIAPDIESGLMVSWAQFVILIEGLWSFIIYILALVLPAWRDWTLLLSSYIIIVHVCVLVLWRMSRRYGNLAYITVEYLHTSVILQMSIDIVITVTQWIYQFEEITRGIVISVFLLFAFTKFVMMLCCVRSSKNESRLRHEWSSPTKTTRHEFHHDDVEIE